MEYNQKTNKKKGCCRRPMSCPAVQCISASPFLLQVFTSLAQKTNKQLELHIKILIIIPILFFFFLFFFWSEQNTYNFIESCF